MLEKVIQFNPDHEKQAIEAFGLKPEEFFPTKLVEVAILLNRVEKLLDILSQQIGTHALQISYFGFLIDDLKTLLDPLLDKNVEKVREYTSDFKTDVLAGNENCESIIFCLALLVQENKKNLALEKRTIFTENSRQYVMKIQENFHDTFTFLEENKAKFVEIYVAALMELRRYD